MKVIKHDNEYHKFTKKEQSNCELCSLKCRVQACKTREGYENCKGGIFVEMNNDEIINYLSDVKESLKSRIFDLEQELNKYQNM